MLALSATILLVLIIYLSNREKVHRIITDIGYKTIMVLLVVTLVISAFVLFVAI